MGGEDLLAGFLQLNHLIVVEDRLGRLRGGRRLDLGGEMAGGDDREEESGGENAREIS